LQAHRHFKLSKSSRICSGVSRWFEALIVSKWLRAPKAHPIFYMAAPQGYLFS
jgi:hypothetical protein